MRYTSLILPLGLALVFTPMVRAQVEPEVLGKKASEWLKILVNDERPQARRAALLAVEVIGPKVDRVLPTLVYVMTEDKDEDLRREAAQTLGRMGEDAKSTIKALARVLADDNIGAVREAAAKALGAMAPHSKSAIGDLGRALKDKHAGTRAAAAASLKDFGEDAKSVLPDALEALKAHRGAEDVFTRVYLSKLIGMLVPDAKDAVPILAEIVADSADDPRSREAAAEALGRFGSGAESAAPQLGAAVTDPKLKKDREGVGARKAALMALGKVSSNPKQVWPHVKDVLAEPDASLRLQAVRAAGPLGKTEKEIVIALEKAALKDENVDVRLAAIQELGALGASGKAALKTLTLLAETEPRPVLREAARSALKNLQKGP